MNMHQTIHSGLLSKDALRMAAIALSKTEWRELMQCLLFLIDVGAKDGPEDNANLTKAYLANHSKTGGDL